MTELLAILLLTYGVSQIVSVVGNIAADLSDSRSKRRRVKRLRSTLRTVCYMRDTAKDTTTRLYYAEQAERLTEKLKNEVK